MHRLIIGLALAFGCVVLSPAPALADPPNGYPPIDWIPAAVGNYDVGRGGAAIVAIVIHETDGSYFSAVNWFRNPNSRTSSHYLVRAWDGGITQFVAESNTAYHARSANPWSIGIEHEFYPRMGIWHTDIQYRSSAKLVCAIAKRYGIPLDRSHIVGHNELPDNNHSDPGRFWNWTYFMQLVRGCSAPVVHESRELRGAPTATLKFGDAGDEVALLQWSLVHLGLMSADDIVGGAGNFGPVTQEAVRAYQHASGLEVTGVYDDHTMGALAKSLANDLAALPGMLLEPSAESDDVGRLQTELMNLGYIDRVTGYYGPLTYEAVARFQGDNGIEATGVYGAVTRVAMVSRSRERSAAPAASDADPAAPVPEMRIPVEWSELLVP